MRGATRWASVTSRRSICFNSRTPCGVRQLLAISQQPTHHVAIHAPRAGCACCIVLTLTTSPCFNSRTPCGVRRSSCGAELGTHSFQFTHPVRGATWYTLHNLHKRVVSIHAPRAGCDNHHVAPPDAYDRFNSRTPCGVRLRPENFTSAEIRVSIHAPRAGCDCDAQRYA